MFEKIDVESMKNKLAKFMPEKINPEDMMNEEYMPEENKVKRIANKVLNIVLVIAIILAAMCTYVSFVSTSGNGCDTSTCDALRHGPKILTFSIARSFVPTNVTNSLEAYCPPINSFFFVN